MSLQPPEVPIFPARYGPAAADFNAWLKDPATFLAAPPWCSVRRTTAQAIPSGTWTTIQFNQVDADGYSGWDAVNFRYAAQAPGWYLVTLKVAANVAAGGTTHALLPGIVTTGILYQGNESWQVTTDTAGMVTTQQFVYLAPGIDWVAGQIHIASAALSTPTATGQQPQMDIVWWSV
ncbi:hypothetical protein [Acrocarpospora catenulata]|uniref:hypothetical protein n=1 Tax=Acrocarpospora catenulata TaxID=2836182 RepID=UPI001BDA5D7C|nr:hypothetical protein [Acrocarpospora catenulata]